MFFVLKSYSFVMTATFKSKRKKIVKMMHADFWLLFKTNVEGDNNFRRSFTREFGNANQLRWFFIENAIEILLTHISNVTNYNITIDINFFWLYSIILNDTTLNICKINFGRQLFLICLWNVSNRYIFILTSANPVQECFFFIFISFCILHILHFASSFCII